VTRYPTPPPAGEELARLLGGPQDGALARVPRVGAPSIRVAGDRYRRTVAGDRDGNPVYAYDPPRGARP
jgi:hypothetical protein